MIPHRILAGQYFKERPVGVSDEQEQGLVPAGQAVVPATFVMLIILDYSFPAATWTATG
ncbi:MAG TPA: hypothetical protein PLY76_05100 [Flavobacteriales bacterium]|nr:hypothetical protein [Flavobacteriales bacterium]HRP81253.1 hypothetical protein [Flavobacteriales bacterium]